MHSDKLDNLRKGKTVQPTNNLDEFCKTRAFCKDQLKAKPRFTTWTQLGIDAGNSIRGDYFITLLELVEKRENKLPNYQMALRIACHKNRLAINGLIEQKRCDFLIGFFKTVNERRING